MSDGKLLPVHGFVLAGGKSSRMGRDKATLAFCGRPMVEIAVEKLRTFCAQVSIAGNRDDLAEYAPVVHEERLEAGPAAGIEAGLKASAHEWAMFVPVDVPLVPAELLRRWAESVISGQPAEHLPSSSVEPYAVSTLECAGRLQPAFCLMHTSQRHLLPEEIEHNQRRLSAIYWHLAGKHGDALYKADAAALSPGGQPTEAELEFWFSNVNDPEELATAELWAQTWSDKLDGIRS